MWETLGRFDNPPTYGIAQKRMDVRERKSPFNSCKTAPHALAQLLLSTRAKVILLSFSNEGFLSETELVKMCQEKGYVLVLRHPHRRYIGAQIGIYNPAGQKVGQISHLHNEERLFIISPKKALIKALAQTLPNPSIYL
jgi:adenine-specific DNA-methyltransferase